jgi:hypothetical protein
MLLKAKVNITAFRRKQWFLLRKENYIQAFTYDTFSNSSGRYKKFEKKKFHGFACAILTAIWRRGL